MQQPQATASTAPQPVTQQPSMTPQQPQNTIAQAPAQAQPEPQTPQEPVRTYIPSPAGVVIGQVDTSKADAALLNADAAEKAAREALALG